MPKGYELKFQGGSAGSATSEGLALTKAFMRIKEPAVRRLIVKLVQQIAGAGN
jgi:hypothetical protein